MDEGVHNNALWLKALELAKGNEERRVSEYIKLRVQSLKDNVHIIGEIKQAFDNDREFKTKDIPGGRQEKKEIQNQKRIHKEEERERFREEERQRQEEKRLERERLQEEKLRSREDEKQREKNKQKRTKLRQGKSSLLYATTTGVLISLGVYASLYQTHNTSQVISWLKQAQVNYQKGEVGNISRKDTIEQQKLFLHKSVSSFVNPILEWKTENYHIRIDNTGDNNIRYAAWAVGKKTSTKPNIVLNSGVYKRDGSGGNYNYTFTNGNYRYRCHVVVIGNHESPPGWLEVLKRDEMLLSERVVESM